MVCWKTALNHRYSQYITSVITLVLSPQWPQIKGVLEGGHLNRRCIQYITSVITLILSPEWPQIKGVLEGGHLNHRYTQHSVHHECVNTHLVATVNTSLGYAGRRSYVLLPYWVHYGYANCHFVDTVNTRHECASNLSLLLLLWVHHGCDNCYFMSHWVQSLVY